ncbi:hypothetical protein [uncultured Jannaschia sp.]|uniref:hypothetical protein n=1 Tax=uncultured Jannaschia sp. TaxID=293347 RepID=UPI00262ECB26|nr:hypothetical protein [uncultured Jannaschia sp.]
MDHDSSNRIALAGAVALALAPAAAPAVTLDALTTRDELGYTCIPEILLEMAYRAESKGVVLPQTCLPEPCKRQISGEELAMLMGRMPDGPEWGRYVARYADRCVAETGGAWEAHGIEDIRDASFDGDDGLSFWAPFVFRSAVLVVPAGVETSPNGSGRESDAAAPPLPIFSRTGRPEAQVEPTPGSDDPDGSLPVVPLPPALWLLLGALGLGASIRCFAGRETSNA